ncbi:hypothetical protein JCM1393_09590 [Clostridium carnis]
MKNKKYLISLILVFLMMALAEYMGEKEIIFPEILALAVGAWIADKQPWKISKIGLVILMTLSAIVGVGIVRYINLGLVIQVAISLVFTGICLKATKTTLVPMISACVLPVIMGTETWIYPISVFLMSLIIVIVQGFMEKYNIRQIQEKTKIELGQEDIKKETVRLVKLFTIIILITIISVKSGNTFLMAPPLIVAFVELSETKSKARKNPKKLFLLFTLAALIGTSARFILNINLLLPLWITAMISTIGVFICFEKLEMLFPPVAAIALLPMILEVEKVKMFSIQVIIGSLLFIVIAMFVFKEENIKVEENIKIEDDEIMVS